MLRLVTLGRVELTLSGSPILSGRRKLLTVLAYMIRENGRTVSRSQLASLFWPVEDEVRARRSVRQALTELRRAVGEGLRERDEGIAITPEAIALDAVELERAVAAGQFEAALELWQGDFLTGAEDAAGGELRSWLESERQGLRSRLSHALEQLIEVAERRGAWETGLALARNWIAALPYDERAQVRHRRLLGLAGRSHDTTAIPEASTAGKGLLSPDLVAREAEFARLTSLWQEVRAGASGVALIEGEAGSGKTRLVEEFLRWVRQQQPEPVVLHARAFEVEQTRPWVLLRHLLAGLASAPGLSAAPPAALRSLSALVPEIADRFPSPALPSDSPGPLTAEAVARALSDVAAEQPVLLAVDDAHLADPASREVLEALCRHPPSAALVLLTASEAQFPELAPLERGPNGGSLLRISLSPLTEPEVERLLSGMADFVPTDRTALVTRLFAEGNGNPLVTIELLTALADRGTIAPGSDGFWVLRKALDQEPLPVPVSIRQAAALRLRQLAPEAGRCLQAAAVLGRESELAVLREVAGLDATGLDAALDQLVSRRFLRLAGDSPIRVEFSHDMVRQAVYQEMAPALRQRMHGRAWRVLRRGARDNARREALTHHRARMGRMASRRTVWLAAAGVFLSIGIGGVAVLATRAPPGTSPTTVAVLPFNVRGESPHAYLREGLVTLLSAALDGLGGLATADAQGVLSLVAGPSLNPERGRAAAERLGAGLFVLGNLIETEGRLELEASLYDSRGKRQTVARANAANETGIYAAVDELAKQLAVGRETTGEEIIRAAAVTTASLPALKAYLAGERHLREGNFGPAVESFQTAVTLDTAFALAYYRLAIAAEWDMRGGMLSEQAARQAARFAEGLTPRARTMVEGLSAWRSGNFYTAQAEYERIVTRYPQDVEAWFQLAEVLFHAGPVVGQPVRQAKAAWREVLRLEPDNRFALLHLARIAGSESDSAAIQELVPRWPELSPDADRRLLELAAWRAHLRGDESELARVTSAMQRYVPSAAAIWQLAIYSRDLAGVERFARFQREKWGQDDLLVPHLALARGEWARADSALAGRDVDRLIARSYAAALPFAALPRERVLQIRNALSAAKPLPASADEGSLGHPRYFPVLRRYLLGALNVRLDDLHAASAETAALERLPEPAQGKNLRKDLTLGLKAMIARARGEPETALRLLEATLPLATPEEIFGSPFHSRALERWYRAELLQELGRGEEALRWYESMAQLSPSELVFLAPAYQRRAEIQESLGLHGGAASLYARFIELWQDADPQSQPPVTRARAQLARLQASR